jgi:hypothetical protein
MSVLRRVRRQWPFSFVAVLVVATAMALPSNVGAVNTVTIGYSPDVVDGSYLNAQNITNNLVFTHVAIQADTSVTIAEDVDLSSSIYGTPAFDVSIIAPTINIGANVNFSAYGNFLLTANTVNLSGKLTSGGSLLNPARLLSTAPQVNVLNNAASIQQATDIGKYPAHATTVQVSPGQYNENLTIAKAWLTLTGNDGTAAPGADPTAPELFGTQAGGQIITVIANNVTIDGLHLNGAVAGGSLAESVNGVYANGVDNLAISQNTFEGFSGTSIFTPGSTNITQAGNLTVLSDSTPPTTTIDLAPSTPGGQNGWYDSDVKVTVAASDDTGVTDTRCVLDPASAPAAFDDISAGCAYTGAGANVTADGMHAVYAASNDAANNKETSVIASFRIDKTPPGVACDVASPVFSLGGAGGSVTATVTDLTSGPAASSVSGAANVSSVGSKSMSLAGTDNAGNQTTVSCPYVVVYDFSGFFQPVDNLPTVNSVKAGSAVPVKFSLAGYQGVGIFASGYPKSESISCNSTAALDGIEETVNAGSSSLAYDALADRYSYVWKTDKAWSNTCRQLVVKLSDGTIHRANFKLLK